MQAERDPSPSQTRGKSFIDCLGQDFFSDGSGFSQDVVFPVGDVPLCHPLPRRESRLRWRLVRSVRDGSWTELGAASTSGGAKSALQHSSTVCEHAGSICSALEARTECSAALAISWCLHGAQKPVSSKFSLSANNPEAFHARV